MVKALQRVASVQLAIFLLLIIYGSLLILLFLAFAAYHTLTNLDLFAFAVALIVAVLVLSVVLAVSNWIYLLAKFGTKDIKFKEIAANTITFMCWAGFVAHLFSSH